MNAKPNTIIQVQNLSKSFGNLQVLKNISLDVYQGDVIAIIGPSGCGKSTFIRHLNMLEKQDEGKILFNGKDIYEKGLHSRFVRERIGMVFQQFNLFKK